MKFLEWIMAIGLCFTIPLAFIPSTIQQYILFIPAFIALYVMVFLLLKKSIHLPIMNLTGLILFIFLITGFKLGIKFDDFISLSGILLIPLIIQLYMVRDPIPFLKKILIIFTIFEIALIGYIASKGGYFDHKANIDVRNTFSFAYPNYIGMFSAVKVGLAIFLHSIGGISNKSRNIMMASGILAIGFSLSRTAFIMLIIIIGLPLFLRNNGNKKNKRRKKRNSLILLIIALPMIIYGINAKNEFSSHATVEYTLNERFGIWKAVEVSMKDNPVLGIGFRSVADQVSDIGYSSTHNDYIDIMMKGGIFMFVILYGFFIKRIFVLFKNKEPVLVSISIAILLGGMSQNPLKFLPTITVFSIILALSYKKELGYEKQSNPIMFKSKAKKIKLTW